MYKLDISYNHGASQVIKQVVKKAIDLEAGRDTICLAMQLIFDSMRMSLQLLEIHGAS